MRLLRRLEKNHDGIRSAATRQHYIQIYQAIKPTFKGPDSPCHLFRLGKLHTTRHRGPVRHR